MNHLPALENERLTLPAVRATADLDILTVAGHLAKSGYFADVKDASQAVVKILAGQELGVGPFQAMSQIHIVKGKPVLSATLVASLIKRSGRYDYRVREHNDSMCVLEFFEGGEPVGTSEFGIEDARRAGLLDNMTWKQYPRNMLFARALSNGARWFAADIFGGSVYTPGEIPEDDAPVIDAPPPRRPLPPHVNRETGEISEPATPYADHTLRPSAPPVDTEEGRAAAQAEMRAALTEMTAFCLWDDESLPTDRFLDYPLAEKTLSELQADAREVRRLIAHAQSKQKQGAAGGDSLRCDECGASLTAGQAAVSRRNFNNALLCPKHQREAKPAA